MKRRGEVQIWEDTPKPGETYGGWFYSISVNGHIIETRGGFLSRDDAAARAGEPKP